MSDQKSDRDKIYKSWEKEFKDEAYRIWRDHPRCFFEGCEFAFDLVKSSLKRDIEKEIKNPESLEPYYVAGLKKALELIETVEP